MKNLIANIITGLLTVAGVLILILIIGFIVRGLQSVWGVIL